MANTNSMEVLMIQNGTKQLLIVANTEEQRQYLESLASGQTQITLITENASVLGKPVTGSLLISQI